MTGGPDSAIDPAERVKTLNALATAHGTDKGFDVGLSHGYVRIYAPMLGRLAGRPAKLLEIGLAIARDGKSCPSLAMWSDFLPDAEILGADIQDYSGFSHPRCQTHVLDQTDRAALLEFARAEGPFDAIIDDGAHLSDAQQISFFALFPALKPGGLYFIEDLHFQPAEEPTDAIKTRALFQAWRNGYRPEAIARLAGRHGFPRAHVAACLAEIQGLQFFDSLAPHRPAVTMADALLLIEKIR